ncbi:MAG: hypothetical protein ACTHU0_18330 [Kofleriaceae bacterium]
MASEGDLCTTCGEPLRWDPTARGTTVGGLDVVGAFVCCGEMLLARESRPAEAAWTLAKGGRSLNAGGIRVRAEATDGDVVALMERLVRLPDLEREVETLRAQLAKVRAHLDTLLEVHDEVERERDAMRDELEVVPESSVPPQPAPPGAIPAMWMDEDGVGPDGIVLVLQHWPPPELAAALSRPDPRVLLVVHPEAGEMYASKIGALFGGALDLHRESVADLHRQLGEWLAAHPVTAGEEVSGAD